MSAKGKKKPREVEDDRIAAAPTAAASGRAGSAESDPTAAATPAGPVVLGATLLIRDAAAAAVSLQAAFRAGTATIDAGAVAQIDTAGLQLLVAAANSAAGRGARLHWSGVSPALETAAARLGLAVELKLPGAA